MSHIYNRDKIPQFLQAAEKVFWAERFETDLVGFTFIIEIGVYLQQKTESDFLLKNCQLNILMQLSGLYRCMKLHTYRSKTQTKRRELVRRPIAQADLPLHSSKSIDVI